MSTSSVARYDELINVLDVELMVIAGMFDGLGPSDWAVPTRLAPPLGGARAWTLRELAGHLDISIGITRMLVESPRSQPPDRDAVTFFVFPEEAPGEFYDYAYTMVEGRGDAELPAGLRATFLASLEEARALPPETVGEFPGFEPCPLIRLDDWVSTRIVEATVHRMDVEDALGRPATASADAIAHAARLFDDLLARGSDAGRPVDLVDDLRWVRAAAGREAHRDPRLPLLH